MPTNSLDESYDIDATESIHTEHDTQNDQDKKGLLPSVQNSAFNNNIHNELMNITSNSTDSSNEVKRTTRKTKTPSYLID